jgi:mannose-6-phosphate isomerase
LEFALSASQQFSAPELAPFRIEPKFTARVWGFRDLRPWYDRVIEGGDPIGEVWLTGDDCLVATGRNAGQRLAEVFATESPALLGANAPTTESPLLIKVIFAQEKLSVQVHPDDAMAQKYGQPRGKTECWYALAAEPGAQVAAGVKTGTTIAQIKKEIQAGTLEDSLNALPIAAGDMVFVDAGTVHAIWPGSILLETQQNSDVTYRMFDYGRPRELHIEKSLEAAKLVTRAGKVAPKTLADRFLLIDVDYFRVERVAVESNRTSESLCGANQQPGLAYLFAASGAGTITGAGFDPVDLPTCGIVAVPAGSPAFMLEKRNGPQRILDLIRIVPNWPGKSR